jgi:SnoaL-like domain
MDAFGSRATDSGRRVRAGRWPRRLAAFVGGLALVAVLAGCGASAGSSAGSTDIQRQADLYGINQIEVKWHQASSTKDLDLMMSLWADDATFTTSSKTYTGKAAIRDFFSTQAAPFKPENHWVSDTPAYKSKATVDGDKGTLYFQCDYIDIDTKQVKVVVSADQQVARVNGVWLIKTAISATPGLGY